MSLEEQQKRFIKLNGDPVYMGLYEAWRQRPMTKVAALSVVFNLATVSQGRPLNILASLGASAGAYMAVYLFSQFGNWVDSSKFGKNHKDLCIDKDASKNSVSTSLPHIDLSKKIRNNNLMWGALASLQSLEALLVGLFMSYYVRDRPIPADMCAIFAGASTAILALTTHLADNAYRFHKVVKGEWVIADIPPPQKQEAKVAADTNAILQPL